LWPFVRPQRWGLTAALLLLPLGALVGLLQPYLVKQAIDRAIVPRAGGLLAPLALVYLAALLLERLTLFLRSVLLERCGQRAMHDLRCAAHRHLLRLPSATFDRTPLGTLLSRVTNDVESVADAFGQGLFTIIGDLLSLIGIVAAMFWLSPRLALIALAVVPPLLLLTRVFRRLMRAAQQEIRRRVAEINATLQEHLGGMKVVQIFGREDRARAELDRVNRAHREAFRDSIRYDSTLFALVELLGSITLALLLWYGGARTGGAHAGGALTFGLLVAFIEYTQRFFVPVRDLAGKVAVMQQATVAAERVFELLDGAPEGATTLAASAVGAGASPAGAAGEARASVAAAQVVLEQVDFAYHPDQPVLRELSLALRPGERVAVVGPSGAGKTTIARLLTRLHEPASGAVLLDGRDVRSLPLEELRRAVVVVNQDAFLFTGTVASNISLDDPAVSAGAVAAAAAAVGLTGLLPLSHEVAGRGANLSAGERQLIAFARALARDPRVLVLDEATASVDPESERLVQAGVAALTRGRTALVIAHRLSTIEGADRIVVLQRGRVVESGGHAELLAAGGLYARLHALQAVAAPAEAGSAQGTSRSA